jgi:hypothetical protein
MARYYQGYFKPLNPRKYKGDPTKIIYRSSWELKLMSFLDSSSSILEWSSESIIIPYYCPVRKSYHRYFPDFWIKKRTSKGIAIDLIEVKPLHQVLPPKKREVKTQKQRTRLIEEMQTYIINSSKWAAAEEYCALRNWNFCKFTEKELDIPANGTTK